VPAVGPGDHLRQVEIDEGVLDRGARRLESDLPSDVRSGGLAQPEVSAA
jgi:hypothetical protein